MTQEPATPLPSTTPEVREGQEVWALCAGGYAVRKIARSGPITVVVIPVSSIEDWQQHGERARCETWPAQDVVPGDQAPPWPELGAVHGT